MIYQNMFDKVRAIIKEDTCMKFYDETKLLYIETDASGVGLGAVLLQTRSNTSCHRDNMPDNSILRSITFFSKSLTVAEEDIAILKEKHWAYYKVLKIPSILLCVRGKYNYGSQTTNKHIQKGCSYIIIEASTNSVKNTPNRVRIIEAWTRPIHSGLAVQTKPQEKERHRNSRHAVKYPCNTINY